MQFQVPQFIEAEDKIVGPFSLKQFGYIGAGAALSFFLYFTVQTWLWFILSFFILGTAAALALVKIGGRPLTRVALSAARFFWEPQIYVWQSSTAPIKTGDEKEIKPPGKKRESIISGMALHGAWQKLQTGGKVSPAQVIERRQREKFQIWRNTTGEREAARRVDYR